MFAVLFRHVCYQIRLDVRACRTKSANREVQDEMHVEDWCLASMIRCELGDGVMFGNREGRWGSVCHKPVNEDATGVGSLLIDLL